MEGWSVKTEPLCARSILNATMQFQLLLTPPLVRIDHKAGVFHCMCMHLYTGVCLHMHLPDLPVEIQPV